jgi:hypothetical protein
MAESGEHALEIDFTGNLSPLRTDLENFRNEQQRAGITVPVRAQIEGGVPGGNADAAARRFGFTSAQEQQQAQAAINEAAQRAAVPLPPGAVTMLRQPEPATIPTPTPTVITPIPLPAATPPVLAATPPPTPTLSLPLPPSAPIADAETIPAQIKRLQPPPIEQQPDLLPVIQRPPPPILPPVRTTAPAADEPPDEGRNLPARRQLADETTPILRAARIEIPQRVDAAGGQLPSMKAVDAAAQRFADSLNRYARALDESAAQTSRLIQPPQQQRRLPPPQQPQAGQAPSEAERPQQRALPAPPEAEPQRPSPAPEPLPQPGAGPTEQPQQPQRVQARRVPPPPPSAPAAAAQEQEPPQPQPTPPNRPLLREGSLRRYVTTGFLLSEAARIGQTFNQREEAYALSAGDPRQQFRAEEQFQSSISSVPFVGQAAGFGAEAIASTLGFGRTGAALTIRAAEIQERRGVISVEEASARRAVQRQTELASANLTGGVFAARRLGAQQQRENTIQDAEQRRQQAADEDAKAIATARAQARQKFIDTPAAFGFSLLNPLAVGRAADVYADQQVQADRTQRAQRRDAALQQTSQSARALEQVQLEDVRRDEVNRRFNFVASGVTARLQGQNNPVFANLNQLLTENSNAAFNAPANLRPAVLEANTERFRAFFNTLRRETKNITDDVNSTAREIDLVTGGNRFAANMERISRQERQALRQLPQIGSLFGVNLDDTLGFSAARQAVGEEADAERRAAVHERQRGFGELVDTEEVARLRGANRPIGADIEQIRRATSRAADEFGKRPELPGIHLPDFALNPERAVTLQTGVNDLEALRRQIMNSFQAGEIAPGSFAPGAGAGGPPSEDLTRAMQDLQRAIDNLTAQMS